MTGTGHMDIAAGVSDQVLFLDLGDVCLIIEGVALTYIHTSAVLTHSVVSNSL